MLFLRPYHGGVKLKVIKVFSSLIRLWGCSLCLLFDEICLRKNTFVYIIDISSEFAFYSRHVANIS